MKKVLLVVLMFLCIGCSKKISPTEYPERWTIEYSIGDSNVEYSYTFLGSINAHYTVAIIDDVYYLIIYKDINDSMCIERNRDVITVTNFKMK